jgi:electron transport complex protein RnfC
MIQHTGAPCEPVVKVGDSVKKGEVVGQIEQFITSPVHASISGKITSIDEFAHPVVGRCKAVVIESDGRDESFSSPRENKNPDKLSKKELLDIIKRNGIVGLGGATFPTHVKLSPPREKSIDSLILNGAECEPYLTSDSRLMAEEPKEILKGLEIIVKILDVKNVYIAIEDNKLLAIHAMMEALSESKLKEPPYRTEIAVLKTKYPQGAEKQIIKSILNREVPAGGLPMDVGCIVQNVGTAFAIYEAVYLGKPLIEKVVTIAGSCVNEPVNIWVSIGTLLGDLVNEFGGFTKEPKKVIFGGPMMGFAQYTMDVPIIKGTSGIIFLSNDEIDETKESVCIRCGKCLEVCPMELAPTALMHYVKRGRFNEAKELGIANCYECGACAYECPAKIPLLDYLKFGKAKTV